MYTFKVGDIVTGVKDSPYSISNQNVIMEVVNIPDSYKITVRIIDFKPDATKSYIENMAKYVNQHFTDVLNPKYFEPYYQYYCYNVAANKFEYVYQCFEKEGVIYV